MTARVVRQDVGGPYGIQELWIHCYANARAMIFVVNSDIHGTSMSSQTTQRNLILGHSRAVKLFLSPLRAPPIVGTA